MMRFVALLQLEVESKVAQRFGAKVMSASSRRFPGIATRMLLGLTRPTAGAITIGGQHIADLPDPARTVGALLDARAVHPHRTAFDHLLVFAQAAGLGRRRVEQVLDLVGLTDGNIMAAIITTQTET